VTATLVMVPRLAASKPRAVSEALFELTSAYAASGPASTFTAVVTVPVAAVVVG
jgi:hypothetical protein